MSDQGAGVFAATIPAAECGDAPQYYIEAVGQTVGPVRFPAGGAGDPLSYIVGEIGVALDEDFESPDAGWDDSIATATTGFWEVGTPDGVLGAPPADFDGSGQCYLTGLGNSDDVDGGRDPPLPPDRFLQAAARSASPTTTAAPARRSSMTSSLSRSPTTARSRGTECSR
jgi:hypothetical protein